jgi:hypothetical protein
MANRCHSPKAFPRLESAVAVGFLASHVLGTAIFAPTPAIIPTGGIESACF